MIHEYVEVLDKYFGNVCELDIIFNFHKGAHKRTAAQRLRTSSRSAQSPRSLAHGPHPLAAPSCARALYAQPTTSWTSSLSAASCRRRTSAR